MRTRAFSSITSPRAVLTMMARGLHQLQPPRRQQMEGRRRVRAVHRDDVHARQHLVEALPVGRLELALDLAMDALAVVVVDGESEAARATRQRLADAAHADDAHALALQARRPASRSGSSRSICRRAPARSPSPMRRAVASTSAIDMSAVSSVSTPGVLVTVMPRWRAGVEIDVIDAGAERGDQLQARARPATARGCRCGR